MRVYIENVADDIGMRGVNVRVLWNNTHEPHEVNWHK